ncbi:MAG: undecaprenyldiphospho-muramoylpentapeptide beta-N-acetylglucosaminyltransferase [Trueperaceae bacterium]|nr:undecaprenyldiphospho-muramoylpentapeptide beta-N-acetylglucosaminyltransferase [Trueperaceae bacterium]
MRVRGEILGHDDVRDGEDPIDVVLATGGTGGHIYPALAVARALGDRGYRYAVVGEQGGMEARLVPAAGVTFFGVRAGKWHRNRPDPRQAGRALIGLVDAVRLLRRLRPRIVVGFGGFASFPALAAARLLRIPVVLHESNVFPGRVTRWFAGYAEWVALGTPELAARLTRARRTEAVGFPVREVVVDREVARATLNLPPDALVTLVMGGSQGSKALNEAVPDAFAELSATDRHNLVVLHSSGPRWAETVRAATEGVPNYHVVPFVDATLAWSAADLAITRAGISTLSEAAFYGVPLIMVPLPSAADDHQSHNARAVAAAGAGELLPEHDTARLADVWTAWLRPDRLEDAAARARTRSPAGAAAHFVALLEPLLVRPASSPTTTPSSPHRPPSRQQEQE